MIIDSIKGCKDTKLFCVVGGFLKIFWRHAVFCVLLPPELNKKPYYIQTGIVFVLLSILCALEGFYVLYKNIVFFILILVLVFILIVFAIASTIVIKKNKK